MTREPQPNLHSELIMIDGADLENLDTMADSALKDAMVRLVREASTPDQTTASFSASL